MNKLYKEFFVSPCCVGRFTCRPCVCLLPGQVRLETWRIPGCRGIGRPPPPHPPRHGPFFSSSLGQQEEREKMKEHLLLVWYLAIGASLPMAGCARTGRSPTHNSRWLLMQGRTRTAADEWEASSRQGILEIGTEAESAREGPHPLRTADWKLEVSRFVDM